MGYFPSSLGENGFFSNLLDWARRVTSRGSAAPLCRVAMRMARQSRSGDTAGSYRKGQTRPSGPSCFRGRARRLSALTLLSCSRNHRIGSWKTSSAGRRGPRSRTDQGAAEPRGETATNARTTGRYHQPTGGVKRNTGGSVPAGGGGGQANPCAFRSCHHRIGDGEVGQDRCLSQRHQRRQGAALLTQRRPPRRGPAWLLYLEGSLPQSPAPALASFALWREADSQIKVCSDHRPYSTSSPWP